jgi:hypothetical protein
MVIALCLSLIVVGDDVVFTIGFYALCDIVSVSLFLGILLSRK